MRRNILKNERGDMSYFTIFVILAINMFIAFVLPYTFIQINCINIRNAAKMELNNVSARIYADTFHSQKEANLNSQMTVLNLSTAYQATLREMVKHSFRIRAYTLLSTLLSPLSPMPALSSQGCA